MAKPTRIRFEPDDRNAGRGKRDADAWARFDAEIQKGVESAERGELHNVHEVFADVKARLRAAIAKKRG